MRGAASRAAHKVDANACDTGRMRQPYGTGDIIEIEFIDADPGAFADPAVGSDGTPRPSRPRPSWLVPVAVATMAALAAAVLVWQPWQRPAVWRTFETPAPAAAALGNHLLPATAPGALTSVIEPASTVGVNVASSAIGYVFAEPEATYWSRRWALFEALATGVGDAQPAPADWTVHGVPASLSHLRVRNDVEWGPLGGFNWHTDSNLLSKQEAVAFASAVGVRQGQAAIRSAYDLGALEPLGSVSAFHSAFALEDALSGSHFATAVEATMVEYVVDTGAAVQVASVPAPPDALALAEFVFGRGSATLVHGLPAVSLTSRDLGNVVTWLEGGRLIAVTGGRMPEADMRALAESIRPVTDDEWSAASQPVLAKSIVSGGAWSSTDEQIDVGSGITATGVPWRASITVGNPMLTCLYTGGNDAGRAACTFSTPLTPSVRAFPGSTAGTVFVVAVLPIDEVGLVLRITDASGGVFDIEPVAANDQLSAVAFEIPATSTFDLVDRTS